jgi:hypothetical protein
MFTRFVILAFVVALPAAADARQSNPRPVAHPALQAAPIDVTSLPPERQLQAQQKLAMLRLSGPRIGLTVLSGESARVAQEDYGIKGSVLTQFGWQFERRFVQLESGPSGVFEWVLLAGGLEQGKLFPSLSWLTGIRAPSGVEFGAGPNLTPAGVGLAVAAGVTIPSGSLNFPVNVAIVSSERGIRTSVLAGFTTRR